MSVNRNQVQVGEHVTFTLSPSNFVTSCLCDFSFDFGDGNPVVTLQPGQTEIIHAFTAPNTYTVSAHVAVRAGTEIFENLPPIQPEQVSITVTDVAITANPGTAEVGQAVGFSSSFEPQNPNIRYRFGFGDGSSSGQWQSEPQASHVYRKEGSYSVQAEIGQQVENFVRPITRSIQIQIPITLGSVNLSADQNSPDVNAPVTFRAKYSGVDENLRYRFDFGDSSLAEWQAEPETAHSYSSEGNYSVRVEVGRILNDEILPLASDNMGVQAATNFLPGPGPGPGPVPSHDHIWLWILSAIGAIAFLTFAYKFVKNTVHPPSPIHPEFHTHTDNGTSTLKRREPFLIAADLHLKENISARQVHVQTTESRFIKSRSRG